MAAHRSRRVGEVAELGVGLQGPQHRVLDLRVAQLHGTAGYGRRPNQFMTKELLIAAVSPLHEPTGARDAATRHSEGACTVFAVHNFAWTATPRKTHAAAHQGVIATTHTRRPRRPLYSAAKGASMWRSASSPIDTVLSVSDSDDRSNTCRFLQDHGHRAQLCIGCALTCTSPVRRTGPVASDVWQGGAPEPCGSCPWKTRPPAVSV